MALWRIRPVAGRGDARWQDHPIYDNVIVRADTAALARVLAARLELSQTGKAPPAGNESVSWFSAFEDEKLYQVQPLEDGAAGIEVEADGPPAVLHHEVLRPGARP